MDQSSRLFNSQIATNRDLNSKNSTNRELSLPNQIIVEDLCNDLNQNKDQEKEKEKAVQIQLEKQKELQPKFNKFMEDKLRHKYEEKLRTLKYICLQAFYQDFFDQNNIEVRQVQLIFIDECLRYLTLKLNKFEFKHAYDVRSHQNCIEMFMKQPQAKTKSCCFIL